MLMQLFSNHINIFLIYPDDRSFWEDLKHCKLPLLLIVGERDAKFKTIAQKMHDEINQNATADCPEMIEIPFCGHAAHLENPLRVISAISQFMRKVKNLVD